jgi:hypothetical protein
MHISALIQVILFQVQEVSFFQDQPLLMRQGACNVGAQNSCVLAYFLTKLDKTPYANHTKTK